MQRFILIALLALVAVASADYTLVVGHHSPGDYLIEQKDVTQGWKPWSSEKEVTITGDGNSVITLVEAIDIKKKPTSAKPFIVSGGPGQTYVSLKFVNAPNHKIHYLVKVYGKRL